jgi:hypothetical protein
MIYDPFRDEIRGWLWLIHDESDDIFARSVIEMTPK